MGLASIIWTAVAGNSLQRDTGFAIPPCVSQVWVMNERCVSVRVNGKGLNDIFGSSLRRDTGFAIPPYVMPRECWVNERRECVRVIDESDDYDECGEWLSSVTMECRKTNETMRDWDSPIVAVSLFGWLVEKFRNERTVITLASTHENLRMKVMALSVRRRNRSVDRQRCGRNDCGGSSAQVRLLLKGTVRSVGMTLGRNWHWNLKIGIWKWRMETKILNFKNELGIWKTVGSVKHRYMPKRANIGARENLGGMEERSATDQ